MGCFNIAGFFTNQMIVNYNPVVAFLCCDFDVIEKHYDGTTYKKHYSMPLSMPIFGEYNDYGGFENIVESPVTKKLEEFFGYDIDNIMRDVREFSVDPWMEPWNKGRYDQIKEYREKDPNEDFMKEEYDRYAPKFEQLRDLVTRYNSMDKKDPFGEDSLAVRLAKSLAKEKGIPEEKTIADARERSWHNIEKENFNVFWAIDHAAVWKALSAKYPDPYRDEDTEEKLSLEEALESIKGICTVRTDEYDGRYEALPGLDTYVLYIGDEPSMREDFLRFLSVAHHNLEFHFRMPHNYGQDWDYQEYQALNKMILKDTKDKDFGA